MKVPPPAEALTRRDDLSHVPFSMQHGGGLWLGELWSSPFCTAALQRAHVLVLAVCHTTGHARTYGGIPGTAEELITHFACMGSVPTRENRVTLRIKVLLHPFCFRLDDCNLSSSNCEDLCSIINMNPSLTELKLNNNELGDAGMEYLCKGLLMPSCSLQKLW